MANLETFILELDKKIWVTKGSRYNKYRRYQTRNWLSLGSISLLTLYLLAVNLALYFPYFKLSDDSRQFIPFLTVVLSIFILILSLLEASKQYQLKAERLYNCANELTTLYNNLRLTISKGNYNQYDTTILDDLVQKYDILLAKYPENHDQIDYEMFQTEHPSVFKLCWCQVALIWMKYLAISYLLYALLIIAPPIFLIFLLFDL